MTGDNFYLHFFDCQCEVHSLFKKIGIGNTQHEIYTQRNFQNPQEAVIKTIPKKKKYKQAKWLSEETLQIAVKRAAKSKGEKERYNHLNAKFQRTERSDKKASLSDECKEIEEYNRMGKTRDLFKKMRGTEGNFCAKMDTIKDRNGVDLTEAEDIKKRQREYTELYKKRSS